MNVWVVGDSEKIPPTAEPQTRNFVWDGPARTVHVRGGRNEYVSFQVVIQAHGQALRNVTVSASDLQGAGTTLARENVACFREHYLEVTVPSQYSAADPVPGRRGPGEYPEQMVPLEPYGAGEYFNVPRHRSQPVWVDLYIPEKTPAGEYQGTLKVSAHKVPEVNLNLHLTVWNFTLPHETHFKTFFYYGPEQIGWAFHDPPYDKLLEVEHQFFQMAHQHRMNLATEVSLADGQFNWGKWWARFGQYVDGTAYTERVGRGVGANLWPVAIDANASEEDFKAACRSVVQFFRGKGLADILFLYASDEPSDREAYDLVRRVGRWVDEAVGDQLPVMVTAQIEPQQPEFGSLVGYVDIWDTDRSTLEQINARRRAGDRIWTYNAGYGGAPYVDTDGLALRTWGWAAWRLGIEAWHFWDVCYWRQKHFGIEDNTPVWEDPLTFDETKRLRDGQPYPARDAIRLNGDGVLFYPGYDVGLDGPVAGFRMKAFRRGAQDYEYFYLLTQAGQRELVDRVVRALMPALRQWSANPEDWYQARVKLGEALDQVKKK